VFAFSVHVFFGARIVTPTSTTIHIYTTQKSIFSTADTKVSMSSLPIYAHRATTSLCYTPTTRMISSISVQSRSRGLTIKLACPQK